MAKAKADLETDTVETIVPVAQPNGELVQVTITKFGEGQVSTGNHIAGEGDEFAKRGTKMWVSKPIANSLEARGLAEAD
jgi:hypothetical protein